MIGVILALAVAAPAVEIPSKPPVLVLPSPHALPSPQDAKSAVSTCGLRDKNVEVRFEPSMDEDIIWVARDSGPLTKPEMSCVAGASLKTSYYVYFRNLAEQKRYDQVYWKLSDEADLADARQWLGARNLLATVPIPEHGQPLSKYAGAVEEFCGVKRGTFLVAVDDHTMTYVESGLGRISPNGLDGGAATPAQFDCVQNATTAADLKAHDVSFGFSTGRAR